MRGERGSARCAAAKPQTLDRATRRRKISYRMRCVICKEFAEDAVSEDAPLPAEFKEKVDELRILIAEKIAALEEDVNWATVEERRARACPR